MLRSVRRAAALVAAPALASVALVAAPSPASAATTDPAPVNAAATWLARQVPAGGLFTGSFGTDFGVSIDVALGLSAAAAAPATVATIRNAVAADVDSYIAYSYSDTSGPHSGETGGATAKALVLAQETGGDVHSFGGVDLVSRLESLLDANGRVVSTFDGAVDASYDNTYIQTLAVEGLAGTGSGAYSKVLGYLIDQQCASGYFRGDIPESAGQQRCGSDAPDTDSTAQAVVALTGETSTPAVAARKAAVDWLVAAQQPNGSFGGGPTTEAPNANSTGLAAYALRAAGQEAAAARAAAWLRGHQPTNAGSCQTFAAADLGAVTYDDAALAEAVTGPMNAKLLAQTLRATSQALPGLLAAPAGTGTRVLFTAEYVPAGKPVSVGVTGAAPSERLCVTGNGPATAILVDAKGEAQIPVALPTTTSKTVVVVTDAAGSVRQATINALGAAKLTVKAKKRVVRGKKLAVVVRGLAPAEAVAVKLPGAKASGLANAKGVFKAKLKVKRKPGKAKVTVRGQFVDRKGATTVKVVKPRRAGR